MSELFESICNKVDNLQLRIDIARVFTENPQNEVVREVLMVLENIVKHVDGTKELLERQKEYNKEYIELTQKVNKYEDVIEKLINTAHEGDVQIGFEEVYLTKISKADEAIKKLCNIGETGREDAIENIGVQKLSLNQEGDNPLENIYESESSCDLDSACKYERPRIRKEKLTPSILMFEMDHIPESVVATIPKYMLGRITLPQINSFIDQINSAISAKYTMLKKQKSALSYAEKKIVFQYKSIQIPDLRGRTFISEEDLVDALGQKCLDKKSLQFITILRHLKKLFIHNDKTTKYYYMN